MQRLFSSFPNAWPGAGLLLLRLTLGASLFADAIARLHQPAISQVLPAVAELLMASVLALGVWTPIAGIVVCLLQLGLAVVADGTLELPLQRAAMALCLALLGPGSWSIDARLFGRRRVEIKNLRDT